ncbi:MAG: uridine kinase [Acidobacteria bacterium]|nr:uridine kinase [Acidobacteriota bacterium]
MQPFVVGIGGGSGAGKTTLARRLAERVEPGRPALLVELDWYYRDLGGLSLDERARTNFDHPDALDWPLLLEQVGSLRQGLAVERPAYDFASHTRLAQRVPAEPTPVMVVEGLLALHDPSLRALLDLKVYVDARRDVRLSRRRRRDVEERGRTPESVTAQFAATVDPMHAQYVEPSRASADLIADGCLDVDRVVEAVFGLLQR